MVGQLQRVIPYKEFKWLKNIAGFNVMSINEKSLIGYFLEVELEYSDILHNYTMIIH